MALSISREFHVEVPADKFWEALKDSQLLPKACKDVIVKVDEAKGDKPAVGSVRVLHFNTDVVPFPYVKEELTYLDEASMTIKSSIIEGGVLGSQVSSQKATVTVKAEGEGSLLLWSMEYEPLVESPDVDKFVEGFAGSVKGIEAFILSGSS